MLNSVLYNYFYVEQWSLTFFLLFWSWTFLFCAVDFFFIVDFFWVVYTLEVHGSHVKNHNFKCTSCLQNTLLAFFFFTKYW